MKEPWKLACGAAMLLWLVGCGGGGGGSTGGTSGGSDNAPSNLTADDFSRMVPTAETSSTTGAVSGTVSDGSGQPVDGATVTCTAGSRAAGGPSFATLTNPNGQYQIGHMPPGTYDIEFSHEGLGEGGFQVQIQPGQVQQGGQQQLRPGQGQQGGAYDAPPTADAGVVLGRVETEAGEPIAGARLSIDRRHHAATGERGLFAFAPLAEGSYVVTCRAEGYVTTEQTAEVVAGEATRLLFSLVAGQSDLPVVEPAQVGGVVTDAETAAPLAAARVVIEAGRAETTTDAQGAFSFTDLRPGGMQLRVEAEGYLPYREPLRLPPGATLTLTIAMVPLPDESELGALRVTISGEDGGPLAGAGVSLDGRPPFFTDESGQVEISRVPAGTHNLTVGARGYERVNDVIEIVVGETAEAAYELERESYEDAPGQNAPPNSVGPGPGQGQGPRPGGQGGQPGGQGGQPGGQGGQPGGQGGQPGGQGGQPGGQGPRPGGQQGAPRPPF